MIVLGIDPGTAATGYGVVAGSGSGLRALDYGSFETPAGESLPVRLLAIHEAIGSLIADHRPQLVAVERLFFNRNVQTAFAVGQARGVVLLAAAEHGLPVFEYGPHEVKMAVTGYGRAGKGEVQRMVQLLLGLGALPKPDDAADALAVAICLAHAHRPAA
ncbi:MAG: crossover junction endodeoxyribonuclease RuvC [Chloroflexota bacterium]|nr:crossover junction endodeoxyribonuclease RuvC [Chloroflexota bacterium]